MNAIKAQHKTIEQMLESINSSIEQNEFAHYFTNVMPAFLVKALEKRGFIVSQPQEIKKAGWFSRSERRYGKVSWE